MRAGRILNIPTPMPSAASSAAKRDRLVQSHRADFDDYRSRLAARAGRRPSAAGGSVQSPARSRPSRRRPPAPRAGPAAAVEGRSGQARRRGARAAATTPAARERALKEAQSRVSRSGEERRRPAEAARAEEPAARRAGEERRRQAGAARRRPSPPSAEAAKPAPPGPRRRSAEGRPRRPKPAALTPAPAAAPSLRPPPRPSQRQPSRPRRSAKQAEPRPEAAKKARSGQAQAEGRATAAAEPSLIDEFLDNPIALAGLAARPAAARRLRRCGHGGARRPRRPSSRTASSAPPRGAGGAGIRRARRRRGAVGPRRPRCSRRPGMEAEEVDPIAEADVYMAYGRDAQAEEILKEALAKDPNRIAGACQAARDLRQPQGRAGIRADRAQAEGLTDGSGPEWDKAAGARALDRSAERPLRRAARCGRHRQAAAAGGAAGAAAAAPALDFDLGGGTRQASRRTDITLDEPAEGRTGFAGARFRPRRRARPRRGAEEPTSRPRARSRSTGRAPTSPRAAAWTSISTWAAASLRRLQPPPAPRPLRPRPTSGGLDFDLNLDLGDTAGRAPDETAAPMDLSAISLDLGRPASPRAARATIRSGRKSRPSSTSPRPTRRWATRTARASCSTRSMQGRRRRAEGPGRAAARQARLAHPSRDDRGRAPAFSYARIALGLEYDGSRFLGWQTQPGGGAVQDALEAALGADRRRRRSSVTCAGRTDRGVHARAGGALRHRAARPDIGLGARRERAAARRGRGALVAPSRRRIPCALQRALAHLSLRAAQPRRCARRSPRAASAGSTCRSTWSAMRAAARAARRRARLLRVPLRRMPGEDAGAHAARARHRAQRRAHRFRAARQRLPAPHGAQHRRHAGLRRQGQASRRDWVGEVLRSRDRARAAPTFGAEGLYLERSSTTHWNCRARLPRDACPHEDARQDLRHHAPAGRARRGARPAPTRSASCSIRPARATSRPSARSRSATRCRRSCRRVALFVNPDAAQVRAGARAACGRRCCSSTARRRPSSARSSACLTSRPAG